MLYVSVSMVCYVMFCFVFLFYFGVFCLPVLFCFVVKIEVFVLLMGEVYIIYFEKSITTSTFVCVFLHVCLSTLP